MSSCSGTTDCDCGCCAGTSVQTPQPRSNAGGLPAISYRVGTWSSFKESMLARLSSADYPALQAAMLTIKKLPTAAGETKVIVNANPNVTYETVVAVLDACRGKMILKPDPAHPGTNLETYEGFGDVLLSAGVN